MTTTKSKTDERRAACAAFDAMTAAPAEGDAVARARGVKVLRPPPGRLAPPTLTAGAAELAREVRAGHFDPSGPRFG